MTSTQTLRRHVERVLQIVPYLWAHPADEVPLARLAELAHFSPYHFHRVYVAVMGESVGDTRQRLRLQHAALDLLQRREAPLFGVARRAGFGSAAAFVRAFRQAYGVPPAAYRRQRIAVLQQLTQLENAMYQPEIRTLTADIAVASVPHRGDYMQIGRAFETLAAYSQLLAPGDGRWFGVYFDDPAVVAPAELRAAACVSVAADTVLPDGLQPQRIAAGRYVVIRHCGPYSELHAAYGWLFGVWLPRSGLQLADAPCVEEYLNSPQHTAPKDLLTDIWLPLAA